MINTGQLAPALYQKSFKHTTFSFSLLFFLIPLISSAQVTIVINRIPENTPSSSSIYIAGSFNEWKPNDDHYKLEEKNGRYEITLSLKTSFEYKFTRGSWESVEGDINGNKVANRTYNYGEELPSEVFHEIKSWEDLHPKNLVTIQVTKIPENTPFEASIFLAGNFNEWKENDPQYQLVKQQDGSYSITFTKRLDTLKYKFTRGSWKAAECQGNGLPKCNRIFQGKISSPVFIRADIDAWSDLPGNKVYFNKFILAIATAAGIFLITAFSFARNKKKNVFLLLLLQVLLISFTLLPRVAVMNQELFNWQPKLLLFSDLIYFLYAPLLFIYFNSYQGIAFSVYSKRVLLSIFIPFSLQIALYLPILLVPEGKFIFGIIDHDYSSFFTVINALALIYNMGYWIINFKIIGGLSKNTDRYLKSLLIHFGICLFAWMLPYLNYFTGLIFNYNSYWIQEEAFNSVWILFSFVSYIHLFYAVSHPEQFRNIDETMERQKTTITPKENLNGLKTELSKVMKKNKPYLNSKLTLQDLAQLMNTNVHTLSRLINEGYNKNFFDFINDYRIEEFIRQVNDEQYKNYTFLAIALEVGFSSKTTFNRAFKKSTGKTPREYFSVTAEV